MKKRKISPRKAPKQGRSRELVDAVVAAATRVLVGQGYEKATTNKVAEVAGVSIGSLYQYFPSKDALVAAVIDRAIERHVKRIEKAVAAVKERPLEDSLRIVLAAAYDLHFDNRALFREMLVQAPLVDRVQNVLRARRRIAELLLSVLEKKGVVPRDRELTMFVLQNATLGVLHAAVLTQSEAYPPHGDRARLIEELALLASGYLRDVPKK